MFNLRQDPNETSDLGTDPVLGAIRDAPIEELLSDCDLEPVEGQMKVKRRELDLILKWVAATDPAEQYRGWTDQQTTYPD